MIAPSSLPPLLKIITASTLCACLVTLTACTALGPDYQPPALDLDNSFVMAGAHQGDLPAKGGIAHFWRGFGDGQLNALIDRALTANRDVKLAQARLQEARALQDEADAAQEPALGINGSGQRNLLSVAQQPGTTRSERKGNTYDANFVASWELDLFGRMRRGSEAAAAQAAAVQASVFANQTSVAAEVARNYLELRGLQQRQQFTQASLVNQKESLRITQARVDQGRGIQLDLARATTLLATTESTLPALQNAIERSIFRLATLTAQSPRQLLAELAVAKPLPGLPFTDLSQLPAGMPQQLLQRRPDLMVAERQLAAATASIDIARSELYPRISFNGLLGLNAADFSSLSNGDAVRYSLGAAINWLPLDLGGVRARIRASQARALQSLVVFEQAVALALEETEGAFSSFTRSAERAEKLAQAVRSAQEAAELARLRYEHGVTDLSALLLAESELLNNRDLYVQAQVATSTSLVAVYRALGGGWTAGQ